ncbi:hypothetical protein ABQ482_22355 [Raoultella ornithinolytica]|uniref:hypothetical protein n=1 Tax=Raoultella ornithinolytica TaxID=54291 RepID=UPI003AAB6F88
MDSVHHIWCPLSSQEFQDLPDGAETTLTAVRLQITEEHPPKRQQQAAAAKAPEITPFTS